MSYKPDDPVLTVYAWGNTENEFELKDRPIEKIDVSIMAGDEVVTVTYDDGTAERFDPLGDDRTGESRHAEGSYSVEGDDALRAFFEYDPSDEAESSDDSYAETRLEVFEDGGWPDTADQERDPIIQTGDEPRYNPNLTAFDPEQPQITAEYPEPGASWFDEPGHGGSNHADFVKEERVIVTNDGRIADVETWQRPVDGKYETDVHPVTENGIVLYGIVMDSEVSDSFKESEEKMDEMSADWEENDHAEEYDETWGNSSDIFGGVMTSDDFDPDSVRTADKAEGGRDMDLRGALEVLTGLDLSGANDEELAGIADSMTAGLEYGDAVEKIGTDMDEKGSAEYTCKNRDEDGNVTTYRISSDTFHGWDLITVKTDSDGNETETDTEKFKNLENAENVLSDKIREDVFSETGRGEEKDEAVNDREKNGDSVEKEKEPDGFEKMVEDILSSDDEEEDPDDTDDGFDSEDEEDDEDYDFDPVC